MNDVNKSATDLIVQAMESADEMCEVVVIYRIKVADGEDEDKGFGWLSNTENTSLRVGMCESAKWGMLQKAYTEEP